jgi:hypothetical protein
MDPRLILFAGAALLLAPAVPLAAAWARVLPSEGPEERLRAGAFSLLLLVVLSLCYAALVPGVPVERVESWLLARMPVGWHSWLPPAGKYLVLLLSAVSAIGAYLRRGPLRKPLLWASLLLMAAWLAVTYLLPLWAGPASF